MEGRWARSDDVDKPNEIARNSRSAAVDRGRIISPIEQSGRYGSREWREQRWWSVVVDAPPLSPLFTLGSSPVSPATRPPRK